MSTTATSATATAAPTETSPRPRRAVGGARRFVVPALRPTRGRSGLGLTLFVLAVAFIGPFVEPHTTTTFTTKPYGLPGGGRGFLGGDNLGRDVLSRILGGGWSLVLEAIAATVLSVVVGALAAVTAAYLAGWVENVIMRLVDVGLALPQLVLSLLLISVVGSSWWLIIIAVGLSQAPQVARVMYSSAQDVVERDYVKVARLWGMAARKVVSREVMPNLLSPLMVDAGIRLSYSIIVVSGLSFLGFGRQPPAADWGVMVNENRLGLVANPWGVVGPALLLAILAIGTNTFSDAIARTTLSESHGESDLVTAELGRVAK